MVKHKNFYAKRKNFNFSKSFAIYGCGLMPYDGNGVNQCRFSDAVEGGAWPGARFLIFACPLTDTVHARTKVF